MASASTTKFANGYPTPGPQCPTAGSVMNHLFFLSGESWKEAREESHFDLVIVGSGCCGYAVAHRALAANNTCKVLIIERGSFFLPEHFQNLSTSFVETLGGVSETFPWTLSSKTALGSGPISWQHGMIPFVGGRTTTWSGWCLTPTANEMHGWPTKTQDSVMQYIDHAKKLLGVVPADEINADENTLELTMKCSGRSCQVYGILQKRIQKALEGAKQRVTGIYRTDPAHLASASGRMSGIDFAKFAVPGPLLDLIKKYKVSTTNSMENRLSVVTECIVERIIHEEGHATALQTSRGILPLTNAKLVLAMGTLPPTTLVSNSFPLLKNIGTTFASHFITSIVAQVPVDYVRKVSVHKDSLNSLEFAACYVGGIADGTFKQQFHIQLSALWNKHPEKNAQKALRYMPDVVSTATLEQLQKSKDCVVFSCAVLGELDVENRKNWFKKNEQDSNLTTNSLLQVVANDTDMRTWDAMDEATFEILENILSTDASKVKYWHQTAEGSGEFTSERPGTHERRVDTLVHESSTMPIGEKDAPVDLDYKLKGTGNVFITGGALWPRGGSWNPTLSMVAMAQDLADKLMSPLQTS